MNDYKAKLSILKKELIDKNKMHNPATSVSLWVEDGLDHINIYNQGRTTLGRSLAHDAPVSFKHLHFGKFSTVTGFWHYIQSEERDDRVRNMHPNKLRMFAKKLTPIRVSNFRAIIMDSNYQKVLQNVTILKELKESTLPLDCYYIIKESGIRVRPGFFSWVIAGFEEIRKALKEERSPDFKFLIDIPESGIYQYVLF